MPKGKMKQEDTRKVYEIELTIRVKSDHVRDALDVAREELRLNLDHTYEAGLKIIRQIS